MGPDFFDWLTEKLTDLGETQILVGKGDIRYVKNLDSRRQYYIVMNAIKEWRKDNAHLFGKKNNPDQE